MHFWVWFGLWLVAWGGAVWYSTQQQAADISYLLLMAAVFFSIFFFTSIARKSYPILWLFLIVIITCSVGWPRDADVNPFVMIMYTYAYIAMIERVSSKMVYLLVSLLLLAFFITTVGVMPGSVTLLIVLSAYLGTYYYQRNSRRLVDLEVWYQALLQRYRSTKRESVTRDQHARQEERVSIGREIHDRVGHTLTNLVMQIEILRMRGDCKELDDLKVLAQESLSETRKAVRAMREDNATGLSAIIHLIRKLEAEQYMSIQFSLRKNALSVLLTPEQASIIYRAIQEAMTNVMRHSPGKEAMIVLEVPGQTHFRFEVSNPVEHQMDVKEGFGLQSMRERLAQLNGHLEVQTYQQQFIVRGLFPLKEGTE
ncbi:sensor histidine kinase [Virgibacillus sp. NKC19-3]|uniref:sensor histidine kinase n=1 Tax=Virgibacillus saliphilus TaxID=2831674 RepID=UPI001C9AF8ED|nr:histidine kinase [Virgibacillus sp. NKC19-3]MBY7142977.1 sensor histidine kinase [Virgibacillus sp. NKC19-3]